MDRFGPSTRSLRRPTGRGVQVSKLSDSRWLEGRRVGARSAQPRSDRRWHTDAATVEPGGWPKVCRIAEFILRAEVSPRCEAMLAWLQGKKCGRPEQLGPLRVLQDKWECATGERRQRREQEIEQHARELIDINDEPLPTCASPSGSAAAVDDRAPTINPHHLRALQRTGRPRRDASSRRSHLARLARLARIRVATAYSCVEGFARAMSMAMPSTLRSHSGRWLSHASLENGRPSTDESGSR